MNLIPKRKLLDQDAMQNSISRNAIDYFQRLDIGTAQIKDLAVTTAKINTLAVTDAKIDSLAVSKLTAGTMTADVTISNTFKTAASPNKRIEITSSCIAGYSDATTKQFYLDASDGKAYCAAGGIIFDSLGMTMKGSVAQIGVYGVTTPTVAVGYLSNGGTDNTLSVSATHANGNLSLDATKNVTIYGEKASFSTDCIGLPASTVATDSEAELRFDSTNHLIKYHNGTTEKTIATTTDITTVATDAIWDEQGDVAYGTGANTAAVLAHGTTGQVLTTKGHGANPEWGVGLVSLLTERGSVIYRNATVPAELLHGTTGQYLETQGDGADPTWSYSTSHTNQQTQADIAPDRAIDTIYQNTSGKARLVHASGYRNNAANLYSYCDTTSSGPTLVTAHVQDISTGETCTAGLTFLVPNGYFYKVSPGAAGFTLDYWTEWDLG